MSTTLSPNVTPSSGSAAAAGVAVGLGALVFGIAVVLSESSPSIADKLNLYNPTGPLSGKTTVGILTWLLSWAILSALWKGKPVRLRPMMIASLVMIAAGFILTFPPVFDALAGKK